MQAATAVLTTLDVDNLVEQGLTLNRVDDFERTTVRVLLGTTIFCMLPVLASLGMQMLDLPATVHLYALCAASGFSLLSFVISRRALQAAHLRAVHLQARLQAATHLQAQLQAQLQAAAGPHRRAG